MQEAAATGTLQSMTGFGRAEGQSAIGETEWRWTWELRSLNSRGLDVKFRLPPRLEDLEAALRKDLGKRFSRGSVSAGLQLRASRSASAVQVDEVALSYMLEQISRLTVRIECAPPQPEQILALRGVLSEEDTSENPEDRAALRQMLRSGFDEAAAALEAARAQEGSAVGTILSRQIDEVEILARRATEEGATEPALLKQRLEQQFAQLLDAALPEDRLVQEAAALAVKADVREELDRLTAHIASARDLLAGGGPIGRKFDFLVQELNREANTLCSKAQSIELKNTGLALKSVIDQMREQIQNVE